MFNAHTFSLIHKCIAFTDFLVNMTIQILKRNSKKNPNFLKTILGLSTVLNTAQ